MLRPLSPTIAVVVFSAVAGVLAVAGIPTVNDVLSGFPKVLLSRDIPMGQYYYAGTVS